VVLAILLTPCLAMSTGTALAQSLFGSAGAEADQEGGYLVFGALGGAITASTAWDLALARSDTSRDFSSLSTVSYDGSLYRDFGRLGIRLGVGGWQDNEVVATRELTGAVDLHGEHWSLALRAERRSSDFEPFAIDRTITRRDGTALSIAARADCALDDLGLGLNLRVGNGPWTFLAGGIRYDYDDPGGSFDVAKLEALDTLAAGTLTVAFGTLDLDQRELGSAGCRAGDANSPALRRCQTLARMQPAWEKRIGVG
jgi:hypothetical protein